MSARVLVNAASLSGGALTREHHVLRELAARSSGNRAWSRPADPTVGGGATPIDCESAPVGDATDGTTSGGDPAESSASQPREGTDGGSAAASGGDAPPADLEYHVLCRPETRDALSDCERLVTHQIADPDGALRRIAWENTGLLRRIRSLDPDLLYFPLHLTNLVDLCPKVSAVRNAAPFYPEAHAGAGRRERFRLRVLRAATCRTIRQSEYVVFMSSTTRDRVAERFPAAREKGVVIPHGVPAGFTSPSPSDAVADRYDLPECFLLCVSNVSRYKNLVELVEGYALARDRTDLPPLCLVGKVVNEGYEREVRERVADLDLDDDVRLLGYVDHGDLPAVHAASDCFVFPSACENAPVTVLEALAAGSPIVSSSAASMPEICGEAAAYFDPYEPEDVGATLAAVWDDPERREHLGELARERATAFSWERAAERTAEVFATVLGGSA